MGHLNAAAAQRSNVILCGWLQQLHAFATGCYGNEVIRTPESEGWFRIYLGDYVCYP